MADRNLFFARPFAFAAKAVAAPTAFLLRFTKRFVRAGRSAPRSKLDTGKWTAELLKRLEWRRLEELCVAYFEAIGFKMRLAYSGADGGVDINLYAGGSESACAIVQCKPWNAYRVGIKAVQALRGVMASGKVGEGVLVTSGKFTQEARDLAGKEGIKLIDGAELIGKIAALSPEEGLALLKFATEGDFLTPTCPSCAIKMISRKSTRQGRTFWGCRNYPRCKQTFSDTL